MLPWKSLRARSYRPTAPSGLTWRAITNVWCVATGLLLLPNRCKSWQVTCLLTRQRPISPAGILVNRVKWHNPLTQGRLYCLWRTRTRLKEPLRVQAAYHRNRPKCRRMTSKHALIGLAVSRLPIFRRKNLPGCNAPVRYTLTRTGACGPTGVRKAIQGFRCANVAPGMVETPTFVQLEANAPSA